METKSLKTSIKYNKIILPAIQNIKYYFNKHIIKKGATQDTQETTEEPKEFKTTLKEDIICIINTILIIIIIIGLIYIYSYYKKQITKKKHNITQYIII